MESKEQITILPTGGAAAVQGQHKVYFPANIYNGVIEVVTPDGKHLKSRPLGVSYDDGSNTIFIAELKSAVGYLTASNQVTYRDAFTGFKADLVCTYRRGGFESDLVFRQQPPTPGDYGLDDSYTTLQLVTEFFNTQDPQEIPAGSDDSYGLQDSTLKFGKLTMMQGKAFAIKSSNSQLPSANSQTPVYKRWLHLDGRKFLIEELPLANLADDLNALPLTASIQKPAAGTLMADLRSPSSALRLPPGHGFVSDTNQILLASANFHKEPGVVLDYTTIDEDQTDFTFQSGVTYFVDTDFYLNGTTTFEGGTVIKIGGEIINNGMSCNGDVICPTDPATPAIFTSKNDDSVGETIVGSSGSPSGGPNFLSLNAAVSPLKNLRMSYANCCIITWSDAVLEISDSQFLHCENSDALDFYNNQTRLVLNNVLFSQCAAISYNDGTGDDGYIFGSHVTVDQSVYGACLGGSMVGGEYCEAYFTNSIFTDIGNTNGLFFKNCVLLSSGSGIYQTAANANYYLAPGSPYRNAGTTNIYLGLLSELQTLTTYAPQDGGWPDTNAPDLGYHYPVNEDSDHDGIPDWWIWKYFGNYNENGTNLDSSGNTLLTDYQNCLDPNVISFTVRLGNQNFNTTTATGSYLVLAGTPSYAAVLVNDTNLADAVWQPYDGSITMNLGSTDGVYSVQFGLKGRAADSTVTWIGTDVTLNRSTPQITLTSPTNGVVAEPWLQLQGYATLPLAKVTYDFNGQTNLQGFVIQHTVDTNTLAYTTDYFQCCDIPLNEGSNAITLHAVDPAGNSFTTNLNVTLDYSTATNPTVKLTWPQNGMELCGSNFTVRGWTEDAAAQISATITDTNGDTNTVIGIVERMGNVWAENLPLNEGTNFVTLTVTNAAGRSSATNFTVVKSDMVLTLDNITGDLWLPTVSMNGSISDTSAAITVNGVQATNNGDGSWNANNVPVSAGGIASFEVNATPTNSGDPAISYNAVKPDELITDSAIFGDGNFLQMGFLDAVDEGNRWTTKGGFNWGAGGTITINEEGCDNDFNYFPVATTVEKLSPDGKSITHMHITYADGTTPAFDSTNVSPFDIQNEQGAFGTQGGQPLQGWDKSSQVEKTFLTGGYGVAGQQVFVTADVTATEEYPISTNIQFDQITVGDLGQADTNGWACGTVANGTRVKVTPKAKVPLHSFTVTPGKNTPVSETEMPAPDDVNFIHANRTKLGVGEKVTLHFRPDLTKNAKWQTTDGGLWQTNYTSNEFTAPSNANPSVAVKVITANGKTLTFPPFNVVEPTSATSVTNSLDTYSAGQQGVGMHLTITWHPTDVSFSRVQMREVGGPASNFTGYFTNIDFSHFVHQANTNFVTLSAENSIGDDHAAFGGYSPPWKLGGFDVDIPIEWKIEGSTITNYNFPHELSQQRIIATDGTSTITKLGTTTTRTP